MRTNNHSIEVQLMRRFNNSMQLLAIAQFLEGVPGDFRSTYNALVKGRKDNRGTVNIIILGHTEGLTMEFVVKGNGFVEITGSTTLQALSQPEYRELEAVSAKIFGLLFRRLCRVYSEGMQASFLGQRYGSQNSRLLRLATVQAFMYSRSFNFAISVHVGYIQCFLTLQVELHDRVENIHFADVMWLDDHPHNAFFPEPLKMWYDLASSRSFIPVAFFITRVAVFKETIANIKSIVSVPPVHRQNMQSCT